MKRLIINGDDYGYTKNISQGIRDAFTKGVLTSTSAIMNYGDPIRDINIAMEETPDLAIGVHLNLYKGKPISPTNKIKTLVNENGVMLGKQGVVENSLVFDIKDIETECRAQIDLFLSTGCSLDHINTHGIDSTCFSTEVWKLMLQFSQEYDCAIRIPIDWNDLPIGAEDFHRQFGLSKEEVNKIYQEQIALMDNYNVFHADRFGMPTIPEFSVRSMVNFVDNLPDGLTETACHPGYSDAELAKFSSVTDERDETVSVLISPELKQAIVGNNIKLTTYTKEKNNLTNL
jgi:hypothetical protein